MKFTVVCFEGNKRRKPKKVESEVANEKVTREMVLGLNRARLAGSPPL